MAQIVVPIAEPLQPDGFALNRFPIPLTDKVEAPWNFHYLQLDRLPVLDISDRSRVDWIDMHSAFAIADRERALQDQGIHTDALLNVKLAIRAILTRAAGVEQDKSRVFGLVVDGRVDGRVDTIIFVPTLRIDLGSHTIVADGYVLPLSQDRLSGVEKATLAGIIGELLGVGLRGDDVATWKQLLPVLVERCRTWKHGPNCEFLVKKAIPL